MIQSWNISNFKAVPANSKGPLDLRQLNILVGPNSSGKSTLLQSILMVAQTLRNSSGERPLILNGDMVKLGHASEVIHEGDEELPVKLSFSILQNGHSLGQYRSSILEPIKVSMELGLPREGNLGFSLIRTSVSKGEKVGVIAERMQDRKMITEINEHPDWYIDATLRNKIKKNWFDYIFLRFTDGTSTAESNYLYYEKYNPKVSFFHFLPNTSLNFYDRDDELRVTTYRYIAGCFTDENNTLPQEAFDIPNLKERSGKLIVKDLRDSLQTVIKSYSSASVSSQSGTDQTLRLLMYDITMVENIRPWIESAQQRLSSPTKKRVVKQLLQDAAELETASRARTARLAGNIGVRETQMPPEIASQVQEVITFFTERVKYLGPLRDDPRAIYGIPINPETKDVGVKGEFTAAVLERYKNEVIEYPLPPSYDYPLGKTRPSELSVAISEWLRYMDLVEDVTTHDLGKIGYELKVRSRGVRKELDLTNVGVGVSQVLPTLVEALLSPQDSLLLLEQPELHLHPKVQSRLGDFILCIALSGKQCIVETHSEYLVNRIRRRIAESEARTILDKTSLYFVERGKQGAEFTKVEPNEFGAILSWPKGFFDEGPAEAELIMAAAMKKRQLTRKIQGNGG